MINIDDRSELSKAMDHIMSTASDDTKINSTDLNMESLRTPEIHNKYVKQLAMVGHGLKTLRAREAVLKREKFEYYTGTADDSVYKTNPKPLKILKQDVNVYIDADADMIELRLRISLLEEMTTFLESVVKSINSRQWIIRNAIEFQKFMNGVG